jgi:selenocysteine lyase/cysteine desulfurase
VLEFFHGDPDEYMAIFTANATQALKLDGESYPFDERGEYLLTFDNHNSVNGIREFARAKHSTVTYVPVVLPDMRVDEEKLNRHLRRPSRGGPRLFAYPAQSNFSGVQHPLDSIPAAREQGWDVDPSTRPISPSTTSGSVSTAKAPARCASPSVSRPTSQISRRFSSWRRRS